MLIKKYYLFFFVTIFSFIAVSSICAQSKNQIQYMLVNADTLNVRRGPSTGYDIIGQLKRNNNVQILESTGQWWKIEYRNIVGYVNSSYLTIINNDSSVSLTSSASLTSTPVEHHRDAVKTNRDVEYQREHDEAVAEYDKKMQSLPPGLRLPNGMTVQEWMDSPGGQADK